MASLGNAVVSCAGGATLHRGVPEDVYFGSSRQPQQCWADRISASDLKEFSTSPLSFYERKFGATLPKRESSALKRGKLLHTWHEKTDRVFWDTLEIVPPEYETATGAFSKKGEKWLESLAGERVAITKAERDGLWSQTRRILGHRRAAELIDQRVDAEFCLQWLWNGTKMRCRVDGATTDCLYDLKTTSDEDVVGGWWRSAKQWKYDLQAAVYLNGALAADWEPHDLRFIVTQTVHPYGCHVVWLPRGVVARAHKRAERMLEDLRNRMEWDHWMPEDYGEERELYCPDFWKGEETSNVEWNF